MKALPFYLTLCVLCPAFAQDVPPPPKPAGDGPTIEVTMKYIQDRLNGEGAVTDQVAYLHTNQEKADGVAELPPTVTSQSTVNAVADAASCTLSFSYVSRIDELGQSEWKVKLSFRDLNKLLVESHEGAARRLTVGLDLDPNRFRYSPIIFLVALVLNSGKTIPYHIRTTGPKGVVTEKDYPPSKEAYVYFREEETAQRMAKAMVHAVELCGGGKDDDPFK